MPRFEIIGLSGKAESGKDHVARVGFKPLGYFPFGFAWHPKIHLIAKELLPFDDVFHRKPLWLRSRMQSLFTGARENIGPDIWCDALTAWLTLLQEQWDVSKFIITDVRFENERDAIWKLGGKVFRVEPIAYTTHLNDEQQAHVSETQLDGSRLFDGVIINDSDDSIIAQVNTLLAT